MSRTSDYSIVAAGAEHEPFLREALYYAAHMDEEPNVRPESAKTNPALNPYVVDWRGRAGDLGFVAVTNSGSPAGVAWLRLMPPDWPLYRYVTCDIPELAIAVLPRYLGRGMGSELLRVLIEASSALHPAIVLSVRHNNPARRLYERIGFHPVANITNRVGGTSVVMKLDLR
jgi:GNAT superfamily N-acetyltransferase